VPPVRQTNFGAGELDKGLHARTDLPLFARGLRTCLNFVPLRTGAAMSRPGTTFVREVKAISRPALLGAAPDLPPRLIPYIYSDDRTYVLELGDRYIRMHTLGRTVMNGAVPYEVLSPWKLEVLPYLRFAQSGAVMTIVSGANPSLDANIKDFPFELVVRVDPGTGAPSIHLAAITSAAASAYSVDDAGVVQLLDQREWSPPTPLFADVKAPYTPTKPFGVVTGSIAAADATHPEREWQVMVTAIIQDPETGVTYETKGQLITDQWDGTTWDTTRANIPDDNWVIYPDKPLTYRRGVGASNPAPPWKILAYFFYRGRGGVFGWVGSTDSREFIDLGQSPDFAKQPPLGNDPFVIFRADGVLARYEFPVSVGFFESRRVFGGTVGALPSASIPVAVGTKYGRPMTLLASSNRDYYDHDKRLVQHVSGEALEYALAMTQREEARHLVPRNRLIVLTNARAWHFGGTSTDPLDFDSVNGRPVDDVGSSHVTPVVVDGLVLFIRNKGFGARALVPVDGERPYQGRDISEQAKHLFIGSGASKRIREWCFQEDPWGVVWAVRGDGVMLTLTIAGDSIGWARHETDGEYESICSVPEGEEDAVYVVVKRNINGADRRFIERFTSRVRRVLEDDDPPRYLAEPAATDTDELYPTDICVDCAFTYAGAPSLVLEVPEMSALNHKDVYVIAKGLPVLGPFRVQGSPANIDLGSPEALGQGLDDVPAANAVDSGGAPIFVARIGLLYTCDLETLSIAGALDLRQKTIAEVGFELDNAKGVQAGQDFDHLDDWMQRQVSDSFEAIDAESTLLYTVVDNSWDKDARVVLRQSQPLPVTVTALAREVVREDG
jgi:hypothetical protein